MIFIYQQHTKNPNLLQKKKIDFPGEVRVMNLINQSGLKKYKYIHVLIHYFTRTKEVKRRDDNYYHREY